MVTIGSACNAHKHGQTEIMMEGDYWGEVVATLHAKGAVQKMRNK